jgi:phosphate transport system permease protein
MYHDLKVIVKFSLLSLQQESGKEKNLKNNISEKVMHGVFLVSACASILAVALICLFIFANGVPAIFEISPGKFLGGTSWKPLEGLFGILPMIVGSIYVTAGGVIFGVPVGILCAVFMAKFCPEKPYKVIKPAIELLAGIPSIVYGFFGLVVLVPMVRSLFGGSGKNILTASIMLGIMILPTIIGVAESSIRAVPESYYEGALGLGATHERAVFFAVLPAAKSGILAGVILGIGRVIGETMAVVMVAGNQAVMPTSLLGGVRTLTSNIVLEMGYASGLHKDALIGTAVVLFVFILIINLSFSAIKKKGRD